MQDFAVMAVLQRKTYLSEVVQYLILGEVLEHAGLLLVLMLVLDLRLHVAIVRIVHDYAQLAFLSLVDLAETTRLGIVVTKTQDFIDKKLGRWRLA